MIDDLTADEKSRLLEQIGALAAQVSGVDDPVVAQYLLDTYENRRDDINAVLADFPPNFSHDLDILIRKASLRSKSARLAAHRSASIAAPISHKRNAQDDNKELKHARPEVNIEVRRSIPRFLSSRVTSQELQRVNAASIAADQKVESNGALSKAAVHAARNSDLRRQAQAETKGPDQKKDSTRYFTRLPPAPKQDLAAVRKSLPVYSYRQKFLDTVAENQVVVVVGDTGSGKTTQLPQYLYEEGYGRYGFIACTQPRRVAASSIAQRVALESGHPQVGDLVGYSMRFEDVTSVHTKIKFMTDGLLQTEIVADTSLRRYAAIMIDEAHERTIATDVLLALLKQALVHRPELRIIISSATLDAQKFAEYFGGCPILNIPGRTFPVEIKWAQEPTLDYLTLALDRVRDLHRNTPVSSGDILVFLTGQEEIDTGCDLLQRQLPDLLVLPVYAALPPDLQARVFAPAPPGQRKAILATNIAETSVTIDGICYVVDSGFSKVMGWNPRLGIETLRIMPISQAQANQRAGRAGRTSPGICYRLYTQQSFQTEMPASPIPEIQRQNLAYTLLLLKSMGVGDVLAFDFLDMPDTMSVVVALEELFQLGALDDSGSLTTLGEKMAKYPLSPIMAKTLLASAAEGYADEVATIMAMVSSSMAVFYRPRNPESRKKAERAHGKFADSTGDHLTLLRIFRSYNSQGNISARRRFCRDMFLQENSLKQALEAKNQLMDLIKKHTGTCKQNGKEVSSEGILKVLCLGFFRNCARATSLAGEYKTLVDDHTVMIHPSSSLYDRRRVEYVIYHSIVSTTREYMQQVSAVKPEWLLEAAPNLFGESTAGDYAKRMKLTPLRTGKNTSDNGRGKILGGGRLLR